MITWGITLIIAGLVITFISFIIAMLNVKNSVLNNESTFDKVIKNHIWAMIGSAFGGFSTLIGLIMTIIWAVQYIMENYS